jgi:hypothetical protein
LLQQSSLKLRTNYSLVLSYNHAKKTLFQQNTWCSHKTKDPNISTKTTEFLCVTNCYSESSALFFLNVGFYKNNDICVTNSWWDSFALSCQSVAVSTFK